MTMTLKTDSSGRAVLKAGLPVFVSSEGREEAVDVAALTSRAAKAEHSAATADAFYRSPFISAKSRMPADVLRATFGQNFKIEAGKLVGYDAAGEKLWSRQRPGEVADFDEALELLVSRSGYSEHILGTPGTQAKAPSDQPGKGTNSVPRAVFDAMPSDKRWAHVRAGGTIHD